MINLNVKAIRTSWLVKIILLTLLGMVAFPSRALAQDSGSLTVIATDISHFPTVNVFLRAYDGQGNFINDLKAGDLQILEDGYDRPVSEVIRTQPGVQIIVAINEAPALTDHYDGVSYYTHVETGLINWANSLSTSLTDDLSFSTNTGVQAARLNSPQEFVQTLQDYQPDLLNKQAGVVSLTQALDLATDPDPDPYKQRSILYITPLPDPEMQVMLPNLTQRAAQLGVQVNVWVVDQNAANNPTATEPLLQLAEQTHGNYFTFSGPEVFPDLNTYYEPMRYIYQVSYLSGASTSGDHHFSLNAIRGDLNAGSTDQKFSVNILPPNPIFLDPPAQVQRSYVQPAEDDGVQTLAPVSIPIQIMVEFPDGFNRKLKSTRLIVDGTIAIENNVDPFDIFNWDITQYTESGAHQIEVEVEDTLGLKSTSITTQVEIGVAKLEKPWWQDLISGNGLVIVIALVVAASVLFLVMIFSGQRGRVASRKGRKTHQRDPVTQQVAIRQEKKRLQIFKIVLGKILPKTNKKPSFESLQRSAPVKATVQGVASAHLLRLSKEGLPLVEGSISLQRREYTLGSDPQKAICVLDSTSVDALHAHLSQTAEGKFILKDVGSVAGTWTNFAPVSNDGVILQHGDIIHLGKIAFRFEMSNPSDLRVPQIFRNNEENL